MPNPMVNPDGTIQAAPPTMSAFAQQPGVMPGQPMAPPTNYQTGTPGFAGALMDMIKALAGSTKTGQTLKQRGNTVMNAADQASGGLGNEFNAGR